MSCEFSNAYLNNDHTLTLETLTGNGTALTSATVNYQIYDSEDTAVSGASGTLTNVGTSNDYSTEVDQDIVNLLTSGSEYTIRVSGSQGGYDFEFNLPIRAKRRGST